MGITWRRTKKLDPDTTVNMSGSGASVTRRIGKHLSVNSRGGITVRIARGLSWRFGRRR